MTTFTIQRYTDFEFHKIDCMISEDGKTLGFFKSHNDRRPSQATYIDKEVAEHLFNMFIGYNGFHVFKKYGRYKKEVQQ
jgi:hypothetical protein